MRIPPESRIFISSTIQGAMRPYRRAAHDALKTVPVHSVLLEREWGSLGRKPRDERIVRRVAKEVRRSSALVAIMGNRTGARVRGTEYSLIEHEVMEAARKRIPILVYITPNSRFYSRLTRGEEGPIDLALLSSTEVIELVGSPDELQSKLRRDIRSRIEAEVANRHEVVVPSVLPVYWPTLASNPDELSKCPSRFFEELVAELLKADGWDVELVARNNVPGPDIIAVSSRLVDSVPLSLIVECKRYRGDRPVGVAAVRNLVYWVNEEYKSTLGMIATTSTFTSEAVSLVNTSHRWRISLKDQQEILRWLRRGAEQQHAADGASRPR